MKELTLFGEIMRCGRIGSGEGSAISCAIFNGYKLAIDDKRAIKEAKKISPNILILKTENIIINMIKENILSINEADEIKYKLEEKYKFRLKFKTFSKFF
jgi:hypothetical protein